MTHEYDRQTNKQTDILSANAVLSVGEVLQNHMCHIWVTSLAEL